MSKTSAALNSATQHAMPPDSAENGERSVLTLGYLCLPCSVRDTAWSWSFIKFPFPKWFCSRQTYSVTRLRRPQPDSLLAIYWRGSRLNFKKLGHESSLDVLIEVETPFKWNIALIFLIIFVVQVSICIDVCFWLDCQRYHLIISVKVCEDVCSTFK